MRWIILVLITFLAGCTAQDTETNVEHMQMQPSSQQEPMQVESSAGTSQISATYKGQVIAGDVTKYIRFNWDDYQKALSEGKVIYFYFYANWCPICREERPKILEAFNEMNYPDVIGFEVHFNDNEVTDDDKKLAREFGISYQHTTVIHVVGVDKTGKEAFRSLSPISKETIKEKIASLV